MLRNAAASIYALLLAALLSACAGSPTQQTMTTAPRRNNTLTYVNPAPAGQQCLSTLGQTQANFTPLPDQYFGAGCSTLNSVRLSWLRSDDAHLQLANIGPVTCSLATALEGWARFGVDRAARQILGSPLSRIDTFGSYNCRNVAGTDRRSAHATANAVDIAGFYLADGHHIVIKTAWAYGTPAERQFLTVIRNSACRRFATVLTPDYNAAHHDHMHLEVGSERPLCR
jgi:hypothetical protein